MAGFKVISCVVNFGDASKVLKISKKYGVKEGIISIGRGTVHSRVLEFFRINEIRKEIVTMIVENELADEAMQGIGKEMAFDKPHHGIAFSYSASKCSDDKIEADKNTRVSEGKNGMYSTIYVIVDRGKAEEVIEAANEAGARGGTIVNARGANTQTAQKLFSIEIEPEKEEVFIITKNELKDGIIQSINRQMKLDEPGNGIIFVVDVAETYGLHEG